MTSTSSRWPNLAAAGAALAAALFAGFDLYQWALAYAADRFHNDFTFYFAAARIGLAHGWGSIYDLALQQAELNAMGSGITIAGLARYISPPPLAWLALPFTTLPFPVAYWIWSGLLLAALAIVVRLCAPGPGWARTAVYFLAAIGWLPVIYSLQLGQPGMFVALGVAGSYALLRAHHPLGAGAALCAVALKPQLAFLVPFALLAAGHKRAFLSSAAAGAGLIAISAVAIGPSGIGAYVDRLTFASSVTANRELTLAYALGDAARPVQAAIVAWTLLIAYRLRGSRLEWVYASALVAGMLATPYVHLDDLAMLGLAALFCRLAGPPRWTWICPLACVLVVEGEPVWGPLPVLVAEAGALALMSAIAIRSRAARPLQQIDARPLEVRQTR